ncbi:hypothetical protein S83_056451 [Arachis hypogaea]
MYFHENGILYLLRLKKTKKGNWLMCLPQMEVSAKVMQSSSIKHGPFHLGSLVIHPAKVISSLLLSLSFSYLSIIQLCLAAGSLYADFMYNFFSLVLTEYSVINVVEGEVKL